LGDEHLPHRAVAERLDQLVAAGDDVADEERLRLQQLDERFRERIDARNCSTRWIRKRRTPRCRRRFLCRLEPDSIAIGLLGQGATPPLRMGEPLLYQNGWGFGDGERASAEALERTLGAARLVGDWGFAAHLVLEHVAVDLDATVVPHLGALLLRPIVDQLRPLGALVFANDLALALLEVGEVG